MAEQLVSSSALPHRRHASGAFSQHLGASHLGGGSAVTQGFSPPHSDRNGSISGSGGRGQLRGSYSLLAEAHHGAALASSALPHSQPHTHLQPLPPYSHHGSATSLAHLHDPESRSSTGGSGPLHRGGFGKVGGSGSGSWASIPVQVQAAMLSPPAPTGPLPSAPLPRPKQSHMPIPGSDAPADARGYRADGYDAKLGSGGAVSSGAAAAGLGYSGSKAATLPFGGAAAAVMGIAGLASLDEVPDGAALLRAAERKLDPLLSRGWRAADGLAVGWNGACLFVAAFCLRVLSADHAALVHVYYAPLVPPLLMLWLWTVNVAVFEARRIRYEVCFSAGDQRCLAPSKAICQIALWCTTLFLSSLAAFCYLSAMHENWLAGWQPPLLYGALVLLLLWPGEALSGSARRLFRSTLMRVAAPGREVTWSDFLLADVLTSLAKPLGELGHAACYMGLGNAMQVKGKACDQLPWLVPVLSALPFLWRLAQCIRVYRDTGAIPQLFNALKYCTALPPLMLAWMMKRAPAVAGEDWAHTWLPMALAAGLVNTAYSYYWDVERDWEISFFSRAAQKEAGTRGALLPAPQLSSELLYYPRFYLYLMVSNLVLRFGWAARMVPSVATSSWALLLLSCFEAFRRFQWAFVRLEVELRKLQRQQPELGTLVPLRRSSSLARDTASKLFSPPKRADRQQRHTRVASAEEHAL